MENQNNNGGSNNNGDEYQFLYGDYGLFDKGLEGNNTNMQNLVLRCLMNSFRSVFSKGLEGNTNVQSLVLKYLSCFPKGYRFNPTDSELILNYLLPKTRGETMDINMIHRDNVYASGPDKLTRMYKPKDGKWYFFTSRQRKYPNGQRPDRKAGEGYWKATGADKAIMHKGTKIGVKKTLDYYEGEPSKEGESRKGIKTSWKMHEFTVERPPHQDIPNKKEKRKLSDEHGNDISMRLDEYVLCKIYKHKGKSNAGDDDDAEDEEQQRIELNPSEKPTVKTDNGYSYEALPFPGTTPLGFPDPSSSTSYYDNGYLHEFENVGNYSTTALEFPNHGGSTSYNDNGYLREFQDVGNYSTTALGFPNHGISEASTSYNVDDFNGLNPDVWLPTFTQFTMPSQYDLPPLNQNPNVEHVAPEYDSLPPLMSLHPYDTRFSGYDDPQNDQNQLG